MSGGRLLIIGGSEDREDALDILDRFVTLCGGPASRIAVITAASKIGELVWEVYQGSFKKIGAQNCVPIHIERRTTADSAIAVAAIDNADGVFMTGGDQQRLLSLVGDTEMHAAMHRALARGAVVAGTSAGASAMSDDMLAYGRVHLAPVKDTVRVGTGFGFVQDVIIDQHFSERHRLSRLLTAVAHNPGLMGIGIDEDTAILIEAGRSIEIMGAGTVTVVDGRTMTTDIDAIRTRQVPEMLDVRMHILPAGSRHVVGESPALHDFLQIVTNIG